MKEELELEPGVVQNPGDSDPLFDNQASSLPDEIKNEEECVQAASTLCRHNCLDYNGEAASLSLSSLLLANHCLQARRAAAAEECRRQSPANPKAQKWKTRSINNYESLAELFAKDRAMGEGAKPAKEKRERWAASTCGNDSETVHGIEGAKPAKEKRERWAASTCGNDSETVHGIDQLLSQNEVIYESFDDLDDGVGMMSKEPPSRTPGQSATTSKGKKRKLSNDVDDVIEVLRGALDNVVEAIREGNSIIEKGRPRVYSGEEIFNELVTLGLEPHLLDDSYLFLMQNPVKSRAFFGCPFDRRKRILEKMMSRFDGH